MRPYRSLRGRRGFALVQRRGRAASAKHLVVFAFSPRSPQSRSTRVGIVITKKIGKAVERNRLRRRCKAILDQSSIAESHVWYVVQFRPAAAGLAYPQLREQLLAALASSTRPEGDARRRRESVGS